MPTRAMVARTAATLVPALLRQSRSELPFSSVANSVGELPFYALTPVIRNYLRNSLVPPPNAPNLYCSVALHTNDTLSRPVTRMGWINRINRPGLGSPPRNQKENPI